MFDQKGKDEIEAGEGKNISKDIIPFEKFSASASLIYEHTYGTLKIAIHPRTLIFYDIYVYN